jgi:DNA-binding LytR/AlgR family response regulator
MHGRLAEPVLAGHEKSMRGRALGTNGGMTGTSGGQAGTSGGGHLVPLLIVAGVAGAISVINATSVMLEARYDSRQLAAWEPWVWEISSMIVWLLLTPVIGTVVRRFPPGRGGALTQVRFVGVHLVAATAASLAHIVGMVWLRKAAYALAGSYYDFSDGQMGLALVYEWRKDVFTYGSNALLYVIYDGWRASRRTQAAAAAMATAEGDARIEVRDGGRVFLIEPGEIGWIEAAGNYVEIHAGAQTHLARGTLAAFETRLAGRGFVRVHRSRLVNRARVKTFRATPSGDLEITLDDGRTVGGSRRYRAGMEG